MFEVRTGLRRTLLATVMAGLACTFAGAQDADEAAEPGVVTEAVEAASEAVAEEAVAVEEAVAAEEGGDEAVAEEAPAEEAAAEEAPAEAPSIDTGDTAWMLVCCGLVLLMTPGLAFFYGGLVRGKNVLGTMMQSLSAMAFMSVLWVVVGYSLAFGADTGQGLIGDFGNVMLKGVPGEVSGTIPALVFMAFQGMFAIITPALIGGSIAERMKFSAWLIFMCLWMLVIYAPLAHWVWQADGWLFKRGALDFAGGTVVHISSGASALVACILMGRRKGFPGEPIFPHNVPFVILGGGLLWFGWFGFNAGSALAANETAAGALVATHTAAATGAAAWLIVDWIRFGRPTAIGTVSGAVAGLVGITPGAGFVSPGSAIAIGAITAVACASFVHWRTRKGLDDSLDAFGVHGVGGTIGAVLTGIFAFEKNGGLIATGDPKQTIEQLIAIGATYVFACVGTVILLKITGAITGGLRVTEEEEAMGLDQTQHGETAYQA